MEKMTAVKCAELHSALADFEKSLSIDSAAFDEAVGDLLNSGKIQKFEICVELLCKTVKVFLLESYGVDIASPKPLMKALYENGLCSEEEMESLLEIIDERNRLSHLYRKSMIVPFLGKLDGYNRIMKNIYDVMHKEIV